jgi:hypothetical protein
VDGLGLLGELRQEAVAGVSSKLVGATVIPMGAAEHGKNCVRTPDQFVPVRYWERSGGTVKAAGMPPLIGMLEAVTNPASSLAR